MQSTRQAAICKLKLRNVIADNRDNVMFPCNKILHLVLNLAPFLLVTFSHLFIIKRETSKPKNTVKLCATNPFTCGMCNRSFINISQLSQMFETFWLQTFLQKSAKVRLIFPRADFNPEICVPVFAGSVGWLHGRTTTKREADKWRSHPVTWFSTSSKITETDWYVSFYKLHSTSISA